MAVELVLYVDVLVLAPCVLVDCMVELQYEFCCRVVRAVGILLLSNLLSLFHHCNDINIYFIGWGDMARN